MHLGLDGRPVGTAPLDLAGPFVARVTGAGLACGGPQCLLTDALDGGHGSAGLFIGAGATFTRPGNGPAGCTGSSDLVAVTDATGLHTVSVSGAGVVGTPGPR